MLHMLYVFTPYLSLPEMEQKKLACFKVHFFFLISPVNLNTPGVCNTHSRVMCENHVLFAHSAFSSVRIVFHTSNNLKFQVWYIDSPKVTCSLSAAQWIIHLSPDRGQKWIMGFEIMEAGIFSLEYVPLVKHMIESLSKFSTRGALSALAEVYLSCLMCLDSSV